MRSVERAVRIKPKLEWLSMAFKATYNMGFCNVVLKRLDSPTLDWVAEMISGRERWLSISSNLNSESAITTPSLVSKVTRVAIRSPICWTICWISFWDWVSMSAKDCCKIKAWLDKLLRMSFRLACSIWRCTIRPTINILNKMTRAKPA